MRSYRAASAALLMVCGGCALMPTGEGVDDLESSTEPELVDLEPVGKAVDALLGAVERGRSRGPTLAKQIAAERPAWAVYVIADPREQAIAAVPLDGRGRPLYLSARFYHQLGARYFTTILRSGLVSLPDLAAIARVIEQSDQLPTATAALSKQLVDPFTFRGFVSRGPVTAKSHDGMEQGPLVSYPGDIEDHGGSGGPPPIPGTPPPPSRGGQGGAPAKGTGESVGPYYCAGAAHIGPVAECARLSPARQLAKEMKRELRQFLSNADKCTTACTATVTAGVAAGALVCANPVARAFGYGIPCVIGSSPATPVLAVYLTAGCTSGLCKSMAAHMAEEAP